VPPDSCGSHRQRPTKRDASATADRAILLVADHGHVTGELTRIPGGSADDGALATR